MHTAGRLVATHLPANTVKPRTAIFCSSVFMRVMSDVAVQCQSDHRYNDSKPASKLRALTLQAIASLELIASLRVAIAVSHDALGVGDHSVQNMLCTHTTYLMLVTNGDWE